MKKLSLLFAFLLLITMNLTNLYTKIIIDSLPNDFPKFTVDTINNPSKGFILFENFPLAESSGNYGLILNSKGKVEKYLKPSGGILDFKMQKNGLFSYCGKDFEAMKNGHTFSISNAFVKNYILNKNFELIDSVQMGNDYLSDFHEFVILPNGNYLLIAYEFVPINMSKVIKDGNPNSKIIVTVIQELNSDKKPIFQWRSLDYIPILDTEDDIYKNIFEHTHGNSLFLDNDGNLIASMATTGEIIKIDMGSGDILWRMGGKNNQFEFIGDDDNNKPYYFTMQHDVKRIDNGNLLFIDNGFQKKSGWKARAVEYKIDEINKKAELTWEFKKNEPIASYAMGSAQRLSNGNTLINWGLILFGNFRTLTEVTPNKNITFELSLPNDAFSYRAHKYDTLICTPIAEVEKYEMMQGNSYKFKNNQSNTGVEVKFIKLDAFMYNSMSVKKFNCSPLRPLFDGEAPIILPLKYYFEPKVIYSHQSNVVFDIEQLPKNLDYNNLTIYYRPKQDSGKFIKLKTDYNSNLKTITALTTSFGEFIIGFERKVTKINPPSLILPYNNESFVNNEKVKLNWSPTGRYDKFKVLISSDDKFIEIIDSLETNETFYNFLSKTNNKKFFWKVKTFYGNLESNWSEIKSFNISNDYFLIDFPNGGEVLEKDSLYIIKWNTNKKGLFRISLFENNNLVEIIADSLESKFLAYNWRVPSNIKQSQNYKIRIECISCQGSNNFSNSEEFFTISNYVKVEENSYVNYYIYPNPTQNNIYIKFNEIEQINDIYIYDLLGNKIKIDYKQIDYNLIDLNTNILKNGIYYIYFKGKGFSKFEKIIINK